MSETQAPAALGTCPYCLAEKKAEAPICPVCNRDVLPPRFLLDERDELRNHRDALLSAIEAKSRRLTP